MTRQDPGTATEYIEAHRSEINEGVRAALSRLDGSSKSTVSLLTGVPVERLDEYGGMSDASRINRIGDDS